VRIGTLKIIAKNVDLHAWESKQDYLALHYQTVLKVKGISMDNFRKRRYVLLRRFTNTASSNYIESHR
jgi:hypothetical protein